MDDHDSSRQNSVGDPSALVYAVETKGEAEKATVPDTRPINEMTLDDYRRGVAKVFDDYRLPT